MSASVKSDAVLFKQLHNAKTIAVYVRVGERGLIHLHIFREGKPDIIRELSPEDDYKS